MDTVFVSGMGGKVSAINFPAASFKQTKISELKYIIVQRMGVGIEIQRLMFGSKDLESQSHGVDMTFGNYNIISGSNIELAIRLPGGGGASFDTISFADITSEEKFKPIEFAPAGRPGPRWRTVELGLNFQGTCENETCEANNKAVMVPKGFYDSISGHCMLNYEIGRLECPMCQTKLKADNVSGVGIYKCKLEVKAKPVDQDEICFEMEAIDKFRLAQSFDEDDKIKYEYIILIVKRL